ncbi:MAG: FUSC family protein [Sarcina sp.]
MKKLNLPPIGARNLKTALAAFICIIIFQVLNKPSAFFACIAAMMCMQDTFENSIKMGKNRMIGTLIGGFIGLIITFLSIKLGSSELVYAILTALGTIASIYLCVLSKAKGAVNSACIVTFAILTNIKGVASYGYAINRIIDTFIGVIVGILVNRHIYPYSKDKLTNEKITENPCNNKEN